MRIEEWLHKPERLKLKMMQLKNARDEYEMCLLPGAITYDKDKIDRTPTDRVTEIMAKISDIDLEIEKLGRIRAEALDDCLAVLATLPEREEYILTAYDIRGERMEDVARAISYSVGYCFKIRRKALKALTNARKEKRTQKTQNKVL